MFQDNLKALRKRKGITQEELATRLNVVRQTVSKWEKGQTLPNADRLKSIAKIGDTSVEYILHGTMDEYIDTLMDKLQIELSIDKKINKEITPFIINEIKNVMYSNASSFLNTDQADKKFDEVKKNTIKSWSDPKSLENNILTNLSRELRTRILDTMKYSYKSYYNNDNEETSAGDYLTENSSEILERLHSLEDFLGAYFDALRFLDDPQIASNLDSLRDLTAEIDQRIK